MMQITPIFTSCPNLNYQITSSCQRVLAAIMYKYPLSFRVVYGTTPQTITHSATTWRQDKPIADLRLYQYHDQLGIILYTLLQKDLSMIFATLVMVH